MADPRLWCEARCGYVTAPARSDGRIGCHETAPGAFGYLAAAKEAKAAKWRVIAGEWCCPACAKALMEVPDHG